MIEQTSKIIEASSHLDSSGRFVASGERLAAAIILALQAPDIVEVSLSGLRGIPSAYFNTVLLAVANQSGSNAIANRIRFRFANDAQRATYQRSLNAVLSFLAENQRVQP